VALRENRAEPGLQRTAPVKIAEQRAFAAGAVHKPVELGKEGVGEIAGRRRTGAAPKNSCGSRAQIAAILADKVFPGRFAVFKASGGQGEIFDMQGSEVVIQLFRRGRFRGEALFGAAVKSSREFFGRKTPTVGPGLCKKRGKPGGRRSWTGACAGAKGLSFCPGDVWYVF
jgi:hypothetical protein